MYICTNMFILFQFSFKNVAKWCKISLVTKRTLKKLVWRLVASSHTRSHTHTLVEFAPGVPCLSHPGVGKKGSQTSGASKWGWHPGVGKWGKHPGQGWASQVLESEGEYDACLSHPRVGSRGLGRGTSGSDVTTAELTLRLATGLFRWIFFSLLKERCSWSW